MDENLIGYLLHALEPEQHRQVEAYLESSPEARRRLELLRGALAPLEADRDDLAPPPGLVIRTLARVAEHCCQDLPRAPLPPRSRVLGFDRSFWRRADLLVAACVLVLVGGLALTAILRLREDQNVVACKENLRQFYTALSGFSDRRGGEFPNVAAEARQSGRPDRAVAGLVAPILVSAGHAPAEVNLRCPGNTLSPVPTPDLQKLLAMGDDDFERLAPRLLSCYAYTLGYREGDTIRGPRRNLDDEAPLMADRPPEDGLEDNSPNHGGSGQNVLYQGGQVRFVSDRHAGHQRDDIYLNRQKKVGAGLDVYDAVLGRSNARP
jgi:hypothetical protein